MNNRDLTKQVIAKMLKENTGSHFLDSGGSPKYDKNGNYLGSSHGYGRHFERNQLRTFEDEPYSILRIDEYGIEYTRNIFHFLTENLYYEKNLNNSLYTFERNVSKGIYQDRFDVDEYSNWYAIVDAWLKFKNYSSGYRDNTYNGENNLTQDFIFHMFTDEPDIQDPDFYSCEYVIIQIHNGCDARGGYTAPKIFSYEDMLLSPADGVIYCEKHEYGVNNHMWYTDDNYHWYQDNRGDNLESYKLVNLEEFIESPEYKESESKMVLVPENQGSFITGYNPAVINPIKYPDGILLYDDDTGYCPICSSDGVLSKLQ